MLGCTSREDSLPVAGLVVSSLVILVGEDRRSMKKGVALLLVLETMVVLCLIVSWLDRCECAGVLVA